MTTDYGAPNNLVKAPAHSGILLVAFALVSTWFCLALTAAPLLAEEAGESKVRSCFDEYRTAVLKADGPAAVARISQKTLDYYAELRELALFDEAPKVLSLDLMDRLMIVSLRHRIPPKQLKAMSAKELFVYAVENGWIGKESVQRLALGTITMSPQSAKATYRYDGQEVQLHFYFYLEDGIWKIDLLSVLRTGDAALQEALRENGKDENEFIFLAIESVTGRRPPQTIWNPPAAH